MSSHYISLFEPWKKALKKPSGVDAVLKDLRQKLSAAQPFLKTCVAIQDYRNFGIAYMSQNIFEITGYYPEHFYEKGIELGLELLHPHDLAEVLVLQKKAFQFIYRTPVNNRLSINIRYYARIKNRKSSNYQYIKCCITPILFDEDWNIVLDCAEWDFAEPLQYENRFNWSLSYINDEGIKITEKEDAGIVVPALTSAEQNVFRFMMKGCSSKEIGESLCISKHTVDTHRRKILKKCQVSSTLELIHQYG